MSKGLSYSYSGTKGDIVNIAGSLPNDPKPLLDDTWQDITPAAAKGKGHMLLQDEETGLRIRFDEGEPGANGFKGKNHYHILNPDATGNSDLYLDKNGNPVRKGSKQSHILPKGE